MKARRSRLSVEREYQRRYRRSPKGKAAVRRANEKYRKSRKGQAARARYLASPKGKAAKRRANKKYIASQQNRAAMQRQYAKRIWRALADRYGLGTLAQIRRVIQQQRKRPRPQASDPARQLARDEKRCRRAIDLIGADYREPGKPTRRPTRLKAGRKKR